MIQFTHLAGSGLPSYSARWQAAKWPSETFFRTGLTVLHVSAAKGHRGWNAHPLGGLSGDGFRLIPPKRKLPLML